VPIGCDFALQPTVCRREYGLDVQGGVARDRARIGRVELGPIARGRVALDPIALDPIVHACGVRPPRAIRQQLTTTIHGRGAPLSRAHGGA